MNYYLIKFYNKKATIVKAFSMSQAIEAVTGRVTSCEKLPTY